MNQDIKWSQIETAQGFATHIPEAIYKLNSPIESVRQNAYWQIDNYAILQSDLYEAAYYIIDPIIKLLEEKYTVDRTLHLRLLIEIALGGNGDKKFFFENTQLETIKNACVNKLKSVKKIIQEIEVKTPKEYDEKEYLTSIIEGE